MPSTGLDGPFMLTPEIISKMFTKTSPGAFALGKSKNHDFMISKVGRSDDDIAKHLKGWVGKYPEFKAGYFDSSKTAFDKECDLYHDYLPGLGNAIHPSGPKGNNWKCPHPSCKEVF